MERPVTTWRSEHPARKMLIFLKQKHGLTPYLNFEPAAAVIACRNQSKSLNLCENLKFCLGFSPPGSCKVCASRNLKEPCVAPPVTIRMKRCPRTQRVTSSSVWIVTRLGPSSPARRVQTTVFNAICHQSVWRGSHPSTITGSASATNRILPYSSRKWILKNEQNRARGSPRLWPVCIVVAGLHSCGRFPTEPPRLTARSQKTTPTHARKMQGQETLA